MKILLVVPPVVYRRQPSISMGYISAYLKSKGYEDVHIWDLNIEISGINDGDDGYWALESNADAFIQDYKNKFDEWTTRILDFAPDIIGFNVWSTSRKQVICLSKLIKEKDPSKLIVFGGPEAVLGDNMFRGETGFDVLVKGEGEETMLDIVSQYESAQKIEHCAGAMLNDNGNLIDCGPRNEIQDLDKLPYPDFTDFKFSEYLFRGHVPISFNRGCKWRCGFCTVENCWKKFRHRSAQNIFDEMLQRTKEMEVKQFVNCDPAINQDLKILSELCDLLIESDLNIPWDGMAQIRPEMDIEFLKKLKKSGCVLMNYGLESGSQQVLDCMHKPYSPEQAKKLVIDTYNAGINVVLNFVVGYPGETIEAFQETLDFIKSIRKYVLNIAHGHPCLVVPYNRLFKHPEKYQIEFSIEDTYNWRSKDGTNTAKERERRADIFDKFLDDLDIEASCGQDDRPALEKERVRDK